MPDIHIVDICFSNADKLSDILLRRRVSVSCGNCNDFSAETVIVSAVAECEMGGTRGLIDKFRICGVKKIIIISENSNFYSETVELGGSIIRVALPFCDAIPLLNSPLLTLANLVGDAVGAMACAANATAQLIDMSRRVAKTDVTVFITGPTGSGKEVLARQIHASSPRAERPFVAVNCAAIPENMLEAILFGHEKGAFTGASTNNKGIIRAADGGTLFLDEISEMPTGLQSKLLRVLQERKVTPIGAQVETPVDIRIIATSNRNMVEEVKAGAFREDLYYRLNVFPLATQPLQLRLEDIAVLANVFAARHLPKGMVHPMIAPEALLSLQSHKWPGNVRELENVIQRALVLCEGAEILPGDLLIDSGETLAVSFMAEAV